MACVGAGIMAQSAMAEVTLQDVMSLAKFAYRCENHRHINIIEGIIEHTGYGSQSIFLAKLSGCLGSKNMSYFDTFLEICRKVRYPALREIFPDLKENHELEQADFGIKQEFGDNLRRFRGRMEYNEFYDAIAHLYHATTGHALAENQADLIREKYEDFYGDGSWRNF